MKELLKDVPTFEIQPNPDQTIFEEVSAIIRKNNNYCCCAIEKTPDSMCMCKSFREQQEGGFCHCGRFYKVQKFPLLTILCAPEDNEHAESLAEGLTRQGFIVMSPMYGDVLSYMKMSDFYNEMQKAKIQKADIILVINSSQAAVDFLEEQIYWAEELQKKIVYEHNEEVKENEI